MAGHIILTFADTHTWSVAEGRIKVSVWRSMFSKRESRTDCGQTHFKCHALMLEQATGVGSSMLCYPGLLLKRWSESLGILNNFLWLTSIMLHSRGCYRSHHKTHFPFFSKSGHRKHRDGSYRLLLTCENSGTSWWFKSRGVFLKEKGLLTRTHTHRESDR